MKGAKYLSLSIRQASKDAKSQTKLACLQTGIYMDIFPASVKTRVYNFGSFYVEQSQSNLLADLAGDILFGQS